MKKLTTLVLAAGLVVSSFAGSASAAEFRPFAQFAEEFVYGDGDSGKDKQSYENFGAATRVRFGFDYIQSEDLSATLLFQYRAHDWGSADGAANFTKDPDANLQMRLAYIDWTIPTTDVKVRMGRQAVVAPSYAFGSAILDGRGDAVSINGNVNDNISLGATWLRLDSGKGGFSNADDSDAIMLTSEFAYDGWKLAPWAMYTHKQRTALTTGGLTNTAAGRPVYPGNNTDFGADAYVIGASFELSMFDPFVFALDALYSNVSYKDGQYRDYPYNEEDSFDGFYVGAKAAYKLNNGTVALKGWYTTGDDNENNGFNHRNDNGFFLLDGGFGATTVLFGDNIIGNDSWNTMTGDSPFGTWGLVAEYAGFSFMDKLTHTARVAYIQGTNEGVEHNTRNAGDLNFSHLTDNDTLIEVDFNSTYQIYENLSATLELGYVFVDMDKMAANQEEHDDIFRSALTFVYNF